jgi:3-oxoacyl-[acyl-carrier-protein] synthase III
VSGLRAVITGTGSWMPPRVVTSAEVEQQRGLAPGWCVRRTGIEERRAAAPGVTSFEMGALAASRALEAAGVEGDQLDHILFHTSYTETHYPTPGVFMQGRLGITKHVPILEVKAACSSFLTMLHLADGLIRSGLDRRILLVCAERLQDTAMMYDATAPLFGDGAAAAVVEARPAEGLGDAGIRWSRNWTDGSGGNLCMATATAYDLTQPDRYPAPPELAAAAQEWADREVGPRRILTSWDGREVFKRAVRSMGQALEEALEATGLQREDVDHFLIHQANAKILTSLMRQYRVPKERVPSNIHRYGNTSSATVPVLLDEGVRSGRIGAGDRVVMVAFGAGFTYSGVVYQVPGERESK